MSTEVVCVGLATADTIVSMAHWPPPDSRVEVHTIARGGGGPAATAAVALARLGHTVTIVGAVGRDAAGAEVRAGLEAEHVDVAHLATVEGATAESVILVDRSTGTRTILHRPGPGVREPDGRAAGAIAGARWLHADHGGVAVLERADPARRSIDEGYPVEHLSLEGVGLYAPSASALDARFPGLPLPAAVRAALEAGAQRVVVTRGADGAIAADATGAWRVPALAAPIVSTLGAGDVFHGALLASILDGLPLAAAARRANLAAALSCGALDGRSAIPTRDELDAAMPGAPDVEPLVLDPRA